MVGLFKISEVVTLGNTISNIQMVLSPDMVLSGVFNYQEEILPEDARIIIQMALRSNTGTWEFWERQMSSQAASSETTS